MIKLQRLGEAAAIIAAGWASLATSETPANLGPPPLTRWVLGNLFDGQTGVPRDIAIELHVGLKDFRPGGGGNSSEVRAKAELALQALSVRRVGDPTTVRFNFEVNEEVTFARPTEPLEENSRYELSTAGISAGSVIPRQTSMPIEFTTRPGPQVTGVWLVEDTLMISFSEAIAKGTLALAADSVDILWNTPSGLQSASTDRNLASFNWDNEGMLFRVAPIPDYNELWVKVSRDIAGESGAPLDGDEDGNPGELEDDFLELVTVNRLRSCATSEDRPEPCVPN